MMLKGLKIILGVTGGISAYKSCELLRFLQKQGAEIKVIMTPSATKMVGIETFQALSQNPVVVDVFNDTRDSNWFEHIDLSRWAELMLIAPATANTIGNLAGGLTPDMLSLMAMATQAPKMIAPAMNTVMLQSPAVQRNLKLLEEDGYQIIPSDSGILACGEVGDGRLPEPQEILDQVIRWKIQKQLSQSTHSLKPAKRVLITAGRTHEAIDPVRYISNTSSGLTGVVFAQELTLAGFDVHLLCGPVDIEIPAWLTTTRFESTQQLDELLSQQFPQCDVLIQAAAVADYRPAQIASEKIKASRDQKSIELSANPDLLKKYTSQANEQQFIIGFALETQDILAHAKNKLKSKGCHMLVVNNPVQSDSGFGQSQVLSGLLLKGQDSLDLQVQTKEDLAQSVITHIHDFFGA